MALIKATLAKATFMAGVVTVLDIAFVKALLTVVASACATGAWGLYIQRDAARQQAKRNAEIHGRLDTLEERQRDVAGAVGVRKRSTDVARDDPPPGKET